MIGKNKILIFAILLICLSAVGFASAADNTTDTVGVDDTSTIAISTDENEEVILEGEYSENLLKVENDDKLAAAPARLSQLRSDILNNPNSVINLTCDYNYTYYEDDSFSVIELNRDVTIDGQGHYVYGYTSHSSLFRVADGKNVVVKNLKIRGFESPTVTGGTYINCQFISCGSDAGASVQKATAIGCTFSECLNFGNNPGAAMSDGRAINCTFKSNTGILGGAIARTYAENCIFENNAVANGGDTDIITKGGAAYESTCYNCIFNSNWANNQGGAGYKGTYVNCRFINNNAPQGDGLYGGTAILCTFEGDGSYNTARYDKLTINAESFTCKYNSSSVFPFKLTAGSMEFKNVNMTFNVDKSEDGVWRDLYDFNILSGNGWIVNMTPGQYRVRMNCIDYPADEVEVIITVEKMATSIIVDNNNISMFCRGDNELVFTLNDENNRPVANRTIILDFKSKLMANVTDENGEIRVALNDLLPRTYNVDITFDGDDTYSKSAARATVTVSKIPTMIIGVPAITVTYNNSYQNIPVGVLDYLNRPVINVALTVELNGNTKDYVTDENGNVFVPTLGLSPGTYSALFYLRNEIYADSYAQTIVTVNKTDVTIMGSMTRDYTSEDSRSNYMGITLTIKPDGEWSRGLRDAEISVSLNGINETYITDINGVAYVSTNGFAAGSYIANVTYKGNEFVNAKNYLAEIVINKVTSQIYCHSNIMRTYYGIEDYFNITLKDKNGNPIKGSNIVTVDLEGVEKTYLTDENGLLQIPTKDLSVGTYSVDITFNGNENYTGSSVYDRRIIIDKDTSVLSSDNLITVYGRTGELVVNLTGSQGRPVSGVNLTVDFNNVEKNYVTDENGQIRIPVEGLAAGNYTADITFKGNKNYEKSSLTANITVDKCEPHLIFDEYLTRAVYGYESLFNVTLEDENYNPVKGNHVITVDLNNVKKNYTTDENGTLTLSTIDLPANEYYVATVTFRGNENFTNATNYHRIIVSRQPTKLTSDNLITDYNEEGNLIVTLKNSLGEILSNYTLTVDFNGKKDYATDENGQIEIPVSGLAAGEYSANITFEGSDNYEGCELIANITVNKATPFVMFEDSLIKTIYGFEYSFNVTLKDNKYVPIKGNNVITANFDGIIKNFTTDENGVAKIYTTDLPVDYYWGAMTFSGNENFTETTNYIRVIVYKQPTELVSDNITTTYNSGEKLQVKLLDAFANPLSGVPVTVNFYGIKTYTTDENGTIEIPTDNLDPSDYLVFISYEGSQNYNQTNLIATISIIKDNTTMDINWTIVDNDVDITVDVNPNATGLVKFEISGPEDYIVYSEIANGKAISHNVLAVGEYSVIATYEGDVYFNTNSTRGTFTVKGHIKKDTPITADVNVDGYTVTITAHVDSNATGNVTVDILGQKFLVPIENGNAVFTYDFAPATYSAEITYLGDNDFNSNSTSTSFTVIEQTIELKNTTITVDVTSVENDVTITSNINPLASGLIEFNINGKVVYVAVISGKAVYNTNLPAGDYNVAVTYLGDFKYNANRTSKAFTVTDHIKKNTTMISDVVVDGYNVDVTVNLDANATGFVEFTLNNNTIYVKVNDGKALYNTLLPVGNYTLTAAYLGDDDFNVNVTDISISVVEIPLNNTPVDVDVEIFENNVTITASVDPAATGLVKFEVTGAEEYTLYAEVKDGKAVLKDVLTAGDYAVVATYLGDFNFYSNSTNETFTIVGHVKNDTSIAAISVVDNYTVTITTSVDPAATGYVTLGILDQTFIVPVDNGNAVFKYDFYPGTYNVNVVYLGDADFNNATTTTSFTVVEKPADLKNTTIDVSVDANENDVAITAAVDSAASGLVEFNIDGKAVYIAVANGKAVYSTELPAGDYNVVVTYLGDSRFNANRTSKAFTVTDHVKKNTSMVPDVVVDGYDVTVTVNLDANATGFVEFTLNNNSIYAKVNDGKAVFNALLPVGNYTLTAAYLGDDDFNVNVTDISISVGEIPLNNTPITAEVLVNENNVTITASVDPAATGFVKFEVTGPEEYTLYADVIDGKAVLEDILVVGDYTVVATYLGDFNFYSNSTNETFTVVGHIKKDTSISAVSTVDGSTVTIVTKVDNNATGHVTLAVLGQTFIVPVNNGEAVFTYDFEPGTYSTLVTYLGDADFNNATTTASFTVIKQVVELKNTTISVDIDSVENNVTIVATVDSAASGLVEFNIDGKSVYVAVNNGKAVYDVVLPAGNYTVVATYMGDSKFNSNKTSKEFTVTDHIKKNTTINSDVIVGGYDVTVTVNVDEQATGFVKFTLNANDIFAEVVDGKAVMNMMLPPGNYTVLAAYLGDNDFNENATVIEFKVTEIPLDNTPIEADVETVENNVTITVSVYEEATGLVKFEISGAENYTLFAEVNNGKAVLEDVLPAGDYTVVATYLGDSRFNSNKTSKDFTVTGHIKKNTTITSDVVVDSYDVTITVNVDENATGFVKFTLNGNNIFAEVVDGKAVMNMLLPAGDYIVNAAYLGDDNFNANETEIEIFVSDIPLNNTPVDVSVEILENNVTITASVDPAATGLVKFEVKGAEEYHVYADVVDGKAVLEDVLTAGDYTVVVTYLGDLKFDSNSTTETFTVVGHVKNNTSIVATATVDDFTVTITSSVDPAATGYVTIAVLGQTFIVPVNDGEAVFTYDFYPGNYNAEVVYWGDVNFNNATTTTAFTVVEKTVDLKNTTIDVNVETNENDVTITAVVDSAASGLVEFNIDNKAVYIAVANGKAVYSTELPAGDYTAVVTYLGDSRFNANRTSKSFTVTDHIKKNTSMTSDVVVDGYDVTVTVNVDENATGFVKFNLNGNNIFAEVVDGKAVMNMLLPAGDYIVNAAYLGDDDFNANETEIEIKVSEIPLNNTPIDVNVETVENNVTITAVVDPAATGLVKFEITGAEDYTLYAEVKDGKAVLEDVLTAGEYTVVATYLGDLKFDSNSTTETFTVVGHVKKDTSISAVSSVDGYTVTIVSTIDSAATGYVTIAVLGQTFIVPVNDGKAVFSYDFAPATYSAAVTYLGDDNFNNASTTTSFTVIEQVVELKNTTISVDVDSVENNVTIVAEVNSSASGLVEFNIDGKAVYVAVNNGKAVYEAVLPAGDYTVVATYMGDSKFNSNKTSKSFSVTDHIKKNTSMTSDVVVDGYDVTLTVNVDKDATGFVKFTLNGNDVFAEVVDGKAVMNMLLPAGNYTVAAAYLGDDDFNANETEIEIKVSEIPLKDTPIDVNVETVENNVTITAVVDSAATGLVKFEISGAEDYTLYAEVKDGKAVLEDVLTTGDYTVVATYLGDLIFNSNTTTESFTVIGHVKKDTAIAAVPTVDKYTVTIESTVDSAATGYVTIAVLGQTFIVPVNDGKAVFSYDFNPGTYSAVVTYLGDDNFNNASTTTSFTVIKQVVELKNTTISVDVDSMENNVTIVAEVDSSASGLVEFNIDGKAVYVAVNNGKAVYEVVLPAGDYTVVATYMGDSRFNSNKTSKSFSVTDHIKKNTSITSDVVVDGYDVTVTVNVDENATGFVKFTLNGNDVFAEVVDGKAVMNMLLPAGDYIVIAAYLGDDDFNANETEIEIFVSDIPLNNTSIDVDVETVENNVTITASVDPAATGLVKFEISGAEDYTLYAEVKDGKAVLEDVLTAGDYTVVATYLGDLKFDSNSTTETFTVVGHVKKDTSISAVSSVDGYTVTIVTTVDSAATGYVTIAILGQTFIVPVNDGKAVFSYDFNPGTYSAAVTYLGDDNFNNASATTSFTVVKEVVELKNTTISVDIDSVDNDVTIVASVDSSASGLVEFNIDGKAVYVAVNNGKAVYEVVLPAGDYTVVATYIGDSKFNSNKTSKSFTVTDHIKKDTAITAVSTVDKYTVTIESTVDSAATGYVTIAVLGQTFMVPVNDGKAVFSYDLAPGTYSAAVTYLGDDNFNNASTTTSFTVIKEVVELKNTTISVDVDSVENNVTIVASVDSSASGLVEFNIDGKAVYVAVNNGKAVYEVVLPAGDYTVVATYMGDSKFNSNKTSKEFNVIGHIKKNTTITSDVVVKDYDVAVTVNVDEKATGFVKFSIYDTDIFAEVIDGKAVMNWMLPAGNYTVVATYMGDDNFNSNATSFEFTVSDKKKEETNVTISIPGDIKAGEEVDVTVSAPGATGNVSVIVDGVEHVIPLDNGTAKYTIPAVSAGDHSVVVVYPGDDTHDAVTVSSAFTAEKESTEADVTIGEITPEGAKVTVSIPGATGNVSVIVDGIEHVVPLENGTATYTISEVTGGEHSVVVVYDGDDTHAGTHVAKTLYVEEFPTRFTNITVADDKLTAVLVLSTGDGLANAPVSIIINGKVVKTTTDANGVLTVGDVSGKVIELKYEGNNTILPTDVTIDLSGSAKVRDSTAFVSSDFEQYACDFYAGERGGDFKFRLTDSQGKALADKTVFIGYNGVTYNRTTDKNGYATVQINLKNAGLYTFVIVFLGDENYNATMAVHKITIDKKPTTISAAAKTFKVTTKTKKYTVTLKTIKGSSVDGKTYLKEGKKVTLKVNGKTYTAKTNSKGQVTFKITNLLKRGKFTAVIKYAGDNTYNSASKKVILTIK